MPLMITTQVIKSSKIKIEESGTVSIGLITKFNKMLSSPSAMSNSKSLYSSIDSTTLNNQIIINPKCKLKKTTNMKSPKQQSVQRKSIQLVSRNILLISIIGLAWLVQSQCLGVSGSLQSSGPFSSFFNVHPQIYSTQNHYNHQNHYQQQNQQQVPFKTSFVGPSDYISFRKMSSPLESLSPNSDESMISGGSNVASSIVSASLASEKLASEANNNNNNSNNNNSNGNEQSKANYDPLMQAASSKAPEMTPNQNDSTATNSTENNSNNSTTSTTTSVLWSTSNSSSTSQQQEQQTTLPLQSTTITPIQPPTTSEMKSQDSVQTTTSTTVNQPATTTLTSNISTSSQVDEEKNLARSSQETTTNDSAAHPKESDATTTQSTSISPSSPTTLKPTTLEITINLSSLSTQSPMMSSSDATTTTTPMPPSPITDQSNASTTTLAITSQSGSENSANSTSGAENGTSIKMTTNSTTTSSQNSDTKISSMNSRDRQKSNDESIADASDRVLEQNLTRTVNEFVFMPQDNSNTNNNDTPLTFEDPKPNKFQAPDTPTSELRAEHRNIDDDIKDDGEVELDYLNPESDRLPAQSQQHHSNSPGRTTTATSSRNTQTSLDDQQRLNALKSTQSWSTSSHSSNTTPTMPAIATTSSSTTTTITTTTTTPKPSTMTTSSTTTTLQPTTTIAVVSSSTSGRLSAKSASNRLISHVVSMLRNTNNNNNNGNIRDNVRSTTKRPRFDWKRGRSTKEFSDDYLRRDFSPIANGADEEEARMLTRLSAPSQLTRLSSVQKQINVGPSAGATNLASQLPEKSRGSRLTNNNNNNSRFNGIENSTNERRVSNNNPQSAAGATAQTTSTTTSIREVGQPENANNNNNDRINGNKRQLSVNLSVRGPSEVRSRNIEIENRDEEPIIGRVSRQQFNNLKNNQKSIPAVNGQDQRQPKSINLPTTPSGLTTSTTTAIGPSSPSSATNINDNSGSTSTTTISAPPENIINTNISVSHQVPTKEILVKTQRASPIPIPTVGVVLQQNSSPASASATATMTSRNLSPVRENSSTLSAISATTPMVQPLSSTTTTTSQGKHIATFGESQESAGQTISPLEEVLTLIAGTAGANVSRAQLLAEINPNQTSMNNNINGQSPNVNQYQYQSSPSVASFTISQEEQSRNAVMEAVVADMMQQRENYEKSTKRALASKQQLTNSYGGNAKSRSISNNKLQQQQQQQTKSLAANTIAKAHSNFQSKQDTPPVGQGATFKLRGSFEEMKQQDEEQYQNALRAEQQQQPKSQASSHDGDGDYKPQDLSRRRQNKQQSASTEPPTDNGKWRPDVTQSPRQYDSSALSSATTSADQMPGRPGIDYPTHWQVPKTSFDCRNFELSGFYADVESSCQAYHSCHKGRGGQHTFLCPNGTLFSQELLTCDWWYNVECSQPTGSRLAGKQTINNLDKSFMLRPANELSSAS